MGRTGSALTGWGRTAPSVARVVDVDPNGSIAGLLDDVDGRGAIARGLGRSYGDAAQNAGGSVLRVRGELSGIDLDADAPGGPTVTVGAGVSLDRLMRALVPRGHFVPVTPGTRFVTVGGAIAADIHGKNHHVDGSFGRHVTRMRLLLADGTVRELDPSGEPELWWATIGGMGLTGVVLDATFRVLPIETSRCRVVTERVPDLDHLVERMEAIDDQARYSVAWIDLVATGRHLGRSVLTWGDHATLDDLAEHGVAADDALAYDPRALARVPPIGLNLLSRAAVRAFNELWYRRAPHAATTIESLTGFFHPLDGVGDWNRLYGPAGFVQYQFLVPLDATDALRTIIETVAASGQASFLAVLKRFGAESGGLLSFPSPGWTLALDLPAGVAGLGDVLARLDAMVLAAGGRHYLAKDATTTPAAIRAGYPRLDEFRRIRAEVDPERRWASDLARRLDLL
jgi:decaprenylphospho-beta-D-ribofuranose 2-oxidase